MAGRAKTTAALAALLAPLPVVAPVTAAALLRTRRRSRPAGGKTVLVSGGKMTKALALARAFHRAGHRVVLVESARYRFTGHRLSRAVSAFHTVPEPADPGYAEALLAVVREEGVDAYVPVSSPAASVYDAEAKALLSEHCDVVHPDAGVVRMLDDKHAFCERAASLGLGVPEVHRITDPAQVLDFDFEARPGPYVLKSIAYDPIRRLDLTPLPRPSRDETRAFLAGLPISEDNPWVMQRFVEGREFCTHTTVRAGRPQLHCCCRSSAFQLNYESVHHPGIEAWVRRFAEDLGATGQLSFDFIETDDGRVQAIECNPRTHSAITMFHDHPGVAAAYLEDGTPEIRPLASSRPTYWLYQEAWRMLSRPREAPAALRRIVRGTDAIFAWRDPLPFLGVHQVQIPSLLLGSLRRGSPWKRIDFNIGKLVEPAGD